MGRIFDILNKPTLRTPSRAEDTVPRSERPQAREQAEVEGDAEIPFIEVGGPRAQIEASESVRAAGLPPVIPFASAAAQVQRRTSAPEAADTPAPGPREVAYQSLTQETAVSPPATRFAPQLIAFHQPHHAVSEQYRSVFNAIASQKFGVETPVLLLVSPVTDVGTTTVALNLAITRATQVRHRAVIVDANLRRPAISERLGLGSKPGLRDVINRTVPLGRAVQETGHPGLWMLSAGDAIADGNSWPTADAIRAVFQQLRTQFDWVLVDGPSWDAGPEMVALASGADAVYLVVKPGMVETPLVEDIARLIPHLGSYLGGYILTQR